MMDTSRIPGKILGSLQAIQKDKGKNNMGKQVKENLGVGIGSMAGMSVMGSMGAIPGMPANTITGTVGAGLGLANVGQLAKTGMGVVGMFANTKTKKAKKSKK